MIPMGTITDFGFIFGSAEVTRVTRLPRGAVVVLIRTKRSEVRVLVTKNGTIKMIASGKQVDFEQST